MNIKIPRKIKNKKKSKKFQSFSNNSAIFNKICKDFYEWVCGVQEDEPLKIEAKNIYFLLETKQHDFALSYSADERFFEILDYGAYFPLEAEYLYSSTLKFLSKQVFQNKTIQEMEVFEILKNVVQRSLPAIDFFKGHSVFFGRRLSKNQAYNCLAKL